MRFDHKTTPELLRLIEAGLGFSLHSNGRSADEIARIQAAALKSGAIITWVLVEREEAIGSENSVTGSERFKS